MSMRNPHIALAVTVVLLFGGGLLLRDASEKANQVLVLLSIGAGFVVLHALDARDKRRGRSWFDR